MLEVSPKTPYSSNSWNSQTKENPIKENNKHRADKEKEHKKKLLVTVVLVKDLKGLELSDKNKLVTKHFSGPTTNDTKLYIQPTILNNPEYILLHCGTSG